MIAHMFAGLRKAYVVTTHVTRIQCVEISGIWGLSNFPRNGGSFGE